MVEPLIQEQGNPGGGGRGRTGDEILHFSSMLRDAIVQNAAQRVRPRSTASDLPDLAVANGLDDYIWVPLLEQHPAGSRYGLYNPWWGCHEA